MTNKFSFKGDEPMHEELLFQYEYIRQSGATNMFDRAAVQTLADIHGFDELAHVTMDRAAYGDLLSTYKRPNTERYGEWLQCNGTHQEIEDYFRELSDGNDEWEDEDDLS